MKESQEINPEYYRERIIDMVRKINNGFTLFKIYHYVLAKFIRNGKEAGD